VGSVVQGLSRTGSKRVHLRVRQDEYGMDCVVFRSVARCALWPSVWLA
jgi:hypothetical protein